MHRDQAGLGCVSPTSPSLSSIPQTRPGPPAFLGWLARVPMPAARGSLLSAKLKLGFWEGGEVLFGPPALLLPCSAYRPLRWCPVDFSAWFLCF